MKKYSLFLVLFVVGINLVRAEGVLCRNDGI